VAAWVIGTRNAQKALLCALLEPNARLRALQDASANTELLMLQEELRTLPMGAVWEEYCARQGVPADERWFDVVMQYEKEVLEKRETK
ncbi:MAG: L-rhamnose isomerase, partial [Clostridia bacterium]